jgi:ribose transport system substrate-binding protein
VFQEEIAYHVLNQGQDLTDVVTTVLESGQPAGKEKIVIYTPATKITKETLHPGMCWSAKNLKN